MKLTYWYSQCPDDNDKYSVRARTKKAAKAQIAEQHNSHRWEAPRKVTVEYEDGFDLMTICSCEGSHWWECSD